MKTTYYIEALPGSDFHDVAKDVCKMAGVTGSEVVIKEFNGTQVMARPGSHPDDLLRIYQLQLSLDNKAVKDE